LIVVDVWRSTDTKNDGENSPVAALLTILTVFSGAAFAVKPPDLFLVLTTAFVINLGCVRRESVSRGRAQVENSQNQRHNDERAC